METDGFVSYSQKSAIGFEPDPINSDVDPYDACVWVGSYPQIFWLKFCMHL